MKMNLRDFIALPFLFLGLISEAIALKVGGRWTKSTVIDSYIDCFKEYKNN